MSFFKTDYLNLTNRICEETQSHCLHKKRIKERFVKCLWMEQPFKNPLFTVDGVRFRIISPGWWNLDAGPDFHNAVISFNEQKPVKGDVEIHTFYKDWQRHRHDTNRRFDNTILHAFLWNDSKKLESLIPQFEISHFLASDIISLKKQINMESYPFETKKIRGDCFQTINTIGKDGIEKVVKMAGDARILKKSKQFRFCSDSNSINNLLYEKLMEALGYRGNREAFTLLAKKIPLRKITDIVRQMGSDQKNTEIVAILLGAGCLLPDKNTAINYSESLNYVNRLKRIWRERSHLFCGEDITWNLFRTRPANLPHRRIAGISRLISNIKDEYLQQIFLDLFTLYVPSSRWAPFFRSFKSIFNDDDPFWSYHYTYTGKRVTAPISLIGDGRLKTIMVNVIIPFLLAHAKEHNDLSLEEKIHAVFSAMPSAESNYITRFMEQRLIGEKMDGKGRAGIEQGLIQIFQDYCLNNLEGCSDCSFHTSIIKLAATGYIT